MKVLMISGEAVPFSKTGGLADVVGALTPVLKKKGIDARIFIPSYNVKAADAGEEVCSFSVPMLNKDEQVKVCKKEENGVVYYFLCHPFFCEREGIYGSTSFEPYPDNFERFALFCKSAIYMCIQIGWIPDFFHCHDWTAGLVPYFVRFHKALFLNTKTVFTIHNLAYQGTFPAMDWLLCGERPSPLCFFEGRINMLRTALSCSDYITTVSPTYAKEIQTVQQGCKLESILFKKRRILKGIINGIDTKTWNPEEDKYLDFHFSAKKLDGKAKLKQQIQNQFNLPLAADIPLFAMISRLASQKGFDVLLPVLEDILKTQRLQFVIVGTGDFELERSLIEMGKRNDNLSVNILFSDSAAHLIEAGADFFLMPSLYEPCGLNQLYSLRYGTIPIAHKTGGLADTIEDIDDNSATGTGLLFEKYTEEEVERHIKRAVKLYFEPGFDKIIKRAMSKDYSWNASAEEYLKLFKRLKKESV